MKKEHQQIKIKPKKNPQQQQQQKKTVAHLHQKYQKQRTSMHQINTFI